jgi:tetratricopeptide (TPR) repeat protein
MDSLEYIDAYYGGELSAEETSQFEKRIQEDPTFADEVAYYLGARVAFKEANVEERKIRFRELYRQGAGREEKRQEGLRRGGVRLGGVRRMHSRKWLPYAAAAAILAIVALSWLLFLRPADPSRLADRYIRQNLTQLPTKMGRTNQLQSGITLYNSGRLAEALRQFEDLLRSDSLNPAAMLDAGIVTLRMENYDKALDYFKELQNYTDPRVNPALFYEALTLMRRGHPGDSDHARQLMKRIVQGDLSKKEDARELLGKM